jgi:hypothetical protein
MTSPEFDVDHRGRSIYGIVQAMESDVGWSKLALVK